MMVGGVVFVIAIKAIGLIGLMGGNVGGHLKQAMIQSSKVAKVGSCKIKKGIVETKFRPTSKLMFIVILFIQIQGVEGTQGGLEAGGLGLGPVGAVMWLGTQFNKKRGGMSRTRILRVAELNMGKRTKAYIAELWDCMESFGLGYSWACRDRLVG
jgi:hypothetical protein